MLRFFLDLHNKIVLISQEEQETFIKSYKFKPEKLSMIYNSIDILKIDLLKNERVDDFSFDKFTFINI
jgi:DNA-directed RNA polymerase subunit H (RpoH/RPB5)